MMTGVPEQPANPVACRILLVEDDQSDADLLSWAMRRQSVPYSLERVTTLAECLTACHRTTFDVVLLDLGLPDMDMCEGVEQITMAAPELAIIVLTGLDDPAMAAMAIRAGAHDYLIKKLDACDLFRSIGAAMARTT